MIFLNIQHERLVAWHFSRERHLGYSLAMIYWHFVDIVWIFLFFFVYVFNNIGFENFSII
jgi:cytochrome c oxidase subunit 3